MDPVLTHWQACREEPPQLACTGLLQGRATQSQRQSTGGEEHALAEQWIPRRHIGKGPGQPPQLACTRVAAGQGDSGRLETEHWRRGTHARRAVDPAETHWQGPRTAAAASLHRAAAGQGDRSSQDRALEAREHARRAVDPAETHWQGPRTAAAASLHRAAAGQRDSGRLEGTEH